MMLNYQYKPFKFYFVTYLITWVALFTAAYFSYNENLAFYKYVFIFIGILIPFTVTLFMIYGSGNDELKKDFLNRLTNLKLIRPKYLLILLVIPFALFLATAISLLFGQPVEQFTLSPGFSLVGSQAVTVLIAVILAPMFEEMGWRGYGVDSLTRKGRSLLISTLLFALLWGLWHTPLFFIKGYYQYEILQAGLIYAVNFYVSVFPVAFLMNWLFYKNGRSIVITFLFHCVINLCSAMLQTDQFTKCIFTLILIAISVIVLLKDKPFWADFTHSS